MGRKRSPGLRNRAGIWHLEKQILGHKICESTGTSNLEEAELILARRIEQIRQEKLFGVRRKHLFREAAARFLEENLHLTSIRTYGVTPTSGTCCSSRSTWGHCKPLLPIESGRE